MGVDYLARKAKKANRKKLGQTNEGRTYNKKPVKRKLRGNWDHDRQSCMSWIICLFFKFARCQRWQPTILSHHSWWCWRLQTITSETIFEQLPVNNYYSTTSHLPFDSPALSHTPSNKTTLRYLLPIPRYSYHQWTWRNQRRHQRRKEYSPKHHHYHLS